MAGKKNKSGGFVYSTNPDFRVEENENIEGSTPKKQVTLKIFLDRLGGSKMVSRVNGFPDHFPEIEELARSLKQKCGVGGSVKNNEILIQGNHRDKILDILIHEGYQAKKAGG
ncbi:MAG: translation initiation factor [Bacteroidetes bacterium]|nr:translation initiation factor [Bacteroidota bacterium]